MTLGDVPAQHHHDTGCDWFASCLRCPLPVCRYDLSQREATLLKTQATDAVIYQRTLELAALPRGEMVEQVAREFGRQKRTVYRVISRQLSERG